MTYTAILRWPGDVRIKPLSSTKMSIFRKGESILHCVLVKSRLVALENLVKALGFNRGQS